MQTFEQLRVIEMEIDVLKHRSKLTSEQIAENERRSAKPEPGSLPPLHLHEITVSFSKLKFNAPFTISEGESAVDAIPYATS